MDGKLSLMLHAFFACFFLNEWHKKKQHLFLALAVLLGALALMDSPLHVSTEYVSIAVAIVLPFFVALSWGQSRRDGILLLLVWSLFFLGAILFVWKNSP